MNGNKWLFSAIGVLATIAVIFAGVFMQVGAAEQKIIRHEQRLDRSAKLVEDQERRLDELEQCNARTEQHLKTIDSKLADLDKDMDKILDKLDAMSR